MWKLGALLRSLMGFKIVKLSAQRSKKNIYNQRPVLEPKWTSFIQEKNCRRNWPLSKLLPQFFLCWKTIGPFPVPSRSKREGTLENSSSAIIWQRKKLKVQRQKGTENTKPHTPEFTLWPCNDSLVSILQTRMSKFIGLEGFACHHQPYCFVAKASPELLWISRSHHWFWREPDVSRLCWAKHGLTNGGKAHFLCWHNCWVWLQSTYHMKMGNITSKVHPSLGNIRKCISCPKEAEGWLRKQGQLPGANENSVALQSKGLDSGTPHEWLGWSTELLERWHVPYLIMVIDIQRISSVKIY